MGTLFFLCALVDGCSTVPSINVFGAYFPDWLFCIMGAIVVASRRLKPCWVGCFAILLNWHRIQRGRPQKSQRLIELDCRGH
ncbi:TPA: hypothetical protein QEM49_000264 [Pseudomonas putida]|nr:hypothetical protein [Pseudomonas putida]